MESFVEATKQGEKEGIYCSLFLTFMGAYMGYKGEVKKGLVFSLMNLFVNYLIGNLRCTRNRALKILERENGTIGRMNRKENGNTN